MDKFLEYFFLGLSNGAIYAMLALALVILMQTMRQPNFAQGEMATCSTFVAWYMLHVGIPYWAAIPLALVFAFFWGAFIQRVFYRPVEKANHASQLLVLVGLYVALNGLSGWIFGYDSEAFPYPFAKEIDFLDNPYITINQMFVLLVIVILIIGLTAFYKYTKTGLALRALAQNPTGSALMGINVSKLLMLNWAGASVMGTIAGILIAPIIFMDKNMMLSVFIYSLASCIVGGIYSPLGAVIGAFMIGMINALVFDYLGLVDSHMQLSGTFLIIVLVMMFKPEGLFAKQTVTRM